jgi:hypothetical protein
VGAGADRLRISLPPPSAAEGRLVKILYKPRRRPIAGTITGSMPAVGMAFLGRDFTAAPTAKLVGDITYLPAWESFAYLAPL